MLAKNFAIENFTLYFTYIAFSQKYGSGIFFCYIQQ
jgi:hypothetical protein